LALRDLKKFHVTGDLVWSRNGDSAHKEINMDVELTDVLEFDEADLEEASKDWG
jgi:hypothetical protein